MVAVTSQIDANSEAFAANRASMMTFIERLRALEARAAEASAKRRATFEKRGQLLPADRLHRLLDPGMPFSGCIRWPTSRSTIRIGRPVSLAPR